MSLTEHAAQPPHSALPNKGRIEVTDLVIELGQKAQRFVALDHVSLSIAPGEFVCVLGPSGCGKSTLLGALAGHLQPAQGELTLDDQRITQPGPERGLVFQHHTLFPWLSVQDNVAYGLKMRGWKKARRLALARELLAELGLSGFEDRYPNALSGGMQQRVEIARILINQPEVLLMDEPFGALDALTRLKMQELLLEIWGRHRMGVVFVTHDIDEALFLGDRLIVMSARPGRILQEITIPAERPRTADWLTHPEFTRLKGQCLEHLRGPHTAGSRERLSAIDPDQLATELEA